MFFRFLHPKELVKSWYYWLRNYIIFLYAMVVSIITQSPAPVRNKEQRPGNRSKKDKLSKEKEEEIALMTSTEEIPERPNEPLETAITSAKSPQIAINAANPKRLGDSEGTQAGRKGCVCCGSFGRRLGPVLSIVPRTWAACCRCCRRDKDKQE